MALCSSHRNLFCAFLLAFVAFAAPIFALSIGCNGQPFKEDGKVWQPMKFDEDGCGFQAAFPGKSKSGISSPWYVVCSKDNDTIYEIHTHMSQLYFLPDSEAEFVTLLQDILSDNEASVTLHISNSYVVYAAEISTYDKVSGKLNKLWRLYMTTDGRIYYAIVEGNDFSVAKRFFEKIKFFGIVKYER